MSDGSEEITEFDYLATVKVLLGITDTSKDSILEVYVGLTKQSILNYCNRSDLPEALNYTLCQICADTYRDTTAKASGAVVSGAVSSISEDGRTVSFSNSLDLIKTAAEDRIAHTTELNRYKKLYRLD